MTPNPFFTLQSTWKVFVFKLFGLDNILLESANAEGSMNVLQDLSFGKFGDIYLDVIFLLRGRLLHCQKFMCSNRMQKECSTVRILVTAFLNICRDNWEQLHQDRYFERAVEHIF